MQIQWRIILLCIMYYLTYVVGDESKRAAAVNVSVILDDG